MRKNAIVGFSLIELMIVVAVIAILASIALASYTNYVTRSNRAEGRAVLLGTAQALERCYTRFSAYNADDCAVSFPIDSETGVYSMEADSQTIGVTTYTISAVPQGSQATRDAGCGTLSYTHTGVRGVTGADPVDECW